MLKGFSEISDNVCFSSSLFSPKTSLTVGIGEHCSKSGCLEFTKQKRIYGRKQNLIDSDKLKYIELAAIKMLTSVLLLVARFQPGFYVNLF